jgi:peptidoglycan/xylan/chitin deacetylase (PgdA/CDA1 family)
MLRCKDVLFPVYGQARAIEPAGDEVVVASEDGRAYGVRTRGAGFTVVRLGYDPFDEVARLLGDLGTGGTGGSGETGWTGQPLERALVPTLDVHIAILRDLILEAGCVLAEIPPAPAGAEFMACLTHDIDFFRLRDHFLDHSMLGFLHRAVPGSIRNFSRGRLGPAALGRNLLAAASLPLVLAGGLPDPWVGFGRYMALEQGVSSTFFLIPFKDRPGDRIEDLGRAHAARRAARYDVADLGGWPAALTRAGHEIGVHGIDAWHCAASGRAELDRVAGACGLSGPALQDPGLGVRMHWLAFDRTSFRHLDQAGFRYDSTVGYNQTPGFRAGTTQVYRPLGADRLLELPMHIQDVSLFYPAYLDLDQDQGLELCGRIIGQAARFGGALTINWHDRSLAPERLWGRCYLGLLEELRRRGGRLCGAGEAVEWFAARRGVRLANDRVEDGWLRLSVEPTAGDGSGRSRPHLPNPADLTDLAIRVWLPGPADPTTLGRNRHVDIPWTGESDVHIPLPGLPFQAARPATDGPSARVHAKEN